MQTSCSTLHSGMYHYALLLADCIHVTSQDQLQAFPGAQADKEAVLLGKALLTAAEPSFRAATAVASSTKAAQWNVYPVEQVCSRSAVSRVTSAFLLEDTSDYKPSFP